MQPAQDAHNIAHNAISGDVWGALKDQLACPFDAARPSTLRKADQGFNLFTDAVIDDNRRPRAVGFNVIEDGLAIALSQDRPLKTHG